MYEAHCSDFRGLAVTLQYIYLYVYKLAVSVRDTKNATSHILNTWSIL